MQARVKGRLGQSQVAHYNLDRLGVQSALHLPSMESTPGSSGNISRFQTLQDTMPDMPEDVKQRLASLLAAEFSKKAEVQALSPLWHCLQACCFVPSAAQQLAAVWDVEHSANTAELS